MKILKLLNKKNLSIIIISLLLSLPSVAEEKPVDIWNLEKQESDSVSEENLSLEKTEQESQSSIYKMQADKNKDSIKLDQDLLQKQSKLLDYMIPKIMV